MKLSKVVTAALLASSVSVANASDLDRLTELEQEIQAIKERLAANDETVKAKEEAVAAKEASKIKIGGAVRFGYSIKDNDFNDAQNDRGGDFVFDVFKINIDGTLDNGITLSADYRFYQYQEVLHHAYLEYPFAENWRGQVGISQVPFGILPYNSNNFYFGTAYYVGLEDDYDAGLTFIGDYGNHDIRFAYYKTDELGGIDGYLANENDGSERYSVDITHLADPSDPFAAPADTDRLAEDSTYHIRYAYDFNGTEVGASYMYGGLEGDSDGSAGSHTAHALHVTSEIKGFDIMLQYTGYKYDLDDSDADTIGIGYFGFFDAIPTEAKIYNLNLAYDWDVNWGPVTNVKLYNDYNIMTDKSGDFKEDTVLNATGLLFTAGSLYTYVDYIVGQNQPFVGGTLVGDSDDFKSLLNVNFGFYF